MRVALCQRASKVGDLQANLERALQDVAAVGPEADLVLLPELFLGGYTAGKQHAELALDLHHAKPLERLQELATEHGCTVVIGGPRAPGAEQSEEEQAGDAAGGGRPRNAAFVVHPGKPTEAYDKVHLPTFGMFEEGLHFTPGTRGLLTTLTDGTRLGVVICYDLFFPEITKDLALRGADLLAVISASPEQSRRYFATVLPARALETTAFVLYCNLVGTQDEITFAGASGAWDPLGGQLAAASHDQEDTLVVDLDLSLIEKARRTRPCLRDTRMPAGGGPAERRVPWPTDPQTLDEVEGRG